MKDQKVIALIRENKSEKAFAICYKDFPKIKRMIISYGGSVADAEDVFQEALIILYNKAIEPSFQLTSKVGTYLYSVAKFIWKDELRKQNKSNSSIEIELYDNHLNDLEEVYEKERKLKAIEAVLETISNKCKEIFQLFYFKKYSMIEIAKQMSYSSERIARTKKYKCMEQAKKNINLQN